MTELSGAEQEFKGFQVHEQLAFVIIGSAGIDRLLPRCGIFCDHRFERIGAPFLQRLRRLHIIMAIDQYRLPGRIEDFLAEDHRIARCRIDPGLVRTGLQQEVPQPFGTPDHVRFVLRLGADGRNPQQRKKLVKEPLPVRFDVCFHIEMS